jgi:hypothetical protein
MAAGKGQKRFNKNENACALQSSDVRSKFPEPERDAVTNPPSPPPGIQHAAKKGAVPEPSWLSAALGHRIAGGLPVMDRSK